MRMEKVLKSIGLCSISYLFFDFTESKDHDWIRYHKNTINIAAKLATFMSCTNVQAS